MTLGPEHSYRVQWRQLRDRLVQRQLADGANPSLSLRVPGAGAMWFGAMSDEEPRRVAWQGRQVMDAVAFAHGSVYAARVDACAMAIGGGPSGLRLADFGGAMPGVFDEQVRHLGHMPPPTREAGELGPALSGGGNVVIHAGTPLVLGMTAARLALNAELFEKCAKAFVLATAAGGPVQPLPWLVRYIANGRLMKDEALARQYVRQGHLPEETKGY